MLQQEYYSVHDGQNLFDVATALYGDSSNANELAFINQISITDILVAGQKIKTIEAKENAQVLQVYKQTAIVPATGLSAEQELVILPGGIGFMQIQNNFKVS